MYFKPSNILSEPYYEGPGQKSQDYSAFGQITGLLPCELQAPSGTPLAGQPVVQGVIPIFTVNFSVRAGFDSML